MSGASLVLGAQWGDEGKGKWVDIFAREADLVVRFQGGDNAGHTLYVQGEKRVLHLIPSGIFHPNTICALTSGVVINPTNFRYELDGVQKVQSIAAERLWISARSHVISPWHIHQDEQSEASRIVPIGTTKRGIGPAYTGKTSRVGLRLGDYINTQARQEWIEAMSRHPEFVQCLDERAEQWRAFHEAAEAIAPFVCDAESKVRAYLRAGKNVLLEGAQGSLLDVDHGTYPFVTSSTTIAGGSVASIGMSPKYIGKIIGISKAYTTRVGAGPFPTELFDDAGKALAHKGQEFGATTKRPRRCGWLDAVALRYSIDINGIDSLILNKLDVLSGLSEVKIATHYEHPELGKISEFPWDYRVLEKCKPVYQTYAGWSQEIDGIQDMASLPKEAITYIRGVEEILGCPIELVGTGVNREDSLRMN